LNCKRRFTTYERIEFVPITVSKRDGRRESFDRSKLLRGMVRACEKTGIPPLRLEAIVDEIEAQLQQLSAREVPSSEIGELVLRHLQSLSEVAYIRFASVYRQFQGIRDFVETLNQLQSRPDAAGTEIEEKIDQPPAAPEKLPAAGAGEPELAASSVPGP
jgi:transcriptional repressor NrdR